MQLENSIDRSCRNKIDGKLCLTERDGVQIGTGRQRLKELKYTDKCDRRQFIGPHHQKCVFRQRWSTGQDR